MNIITKGLKIMSNFLDELKAELHEFHGNADVTAQINDVLDAKVAPLIAEINALKAKEADDVAELQQGVKAVADTITGNTGTDTVADAPVETVVGDAGNDTVTGGADSVSQ